jgi:hypothetical protein
MTIVVAQDAFSPAEPAITEIEIPRDADDIAQAGPAVVLREDLRWVPERFLLGSLGRAAIRGQAPFEIVVRADDGSVVLEAVEINEFGYGANLCEAIADLQATIVELFETLEREVERLGPDLQRVRLTLQEKVELRRPRAG